MDLLTWPVLGRFFKWRHARTVLQVPVLLIATLIIFDGLVGPQLAPKNLATVGVWLHYRGLVVLALLVAGNLFCMACPFMLPRQAARRLRERFLGGGRPVPAWLRNKWLAIGLVVLFFWCYEAFDLWATPWWTAWIAVGYFVAACAVDMIFRGAAFCKYLCPLGQFNFFGSLISPLEIKVREPAMCTACQTKDCITARRTASSPRSHASARHGRAVLSLFAQGGGEGTSALSSVVRGCELWLFQERKVGNMDCTFCLDCVHACPYDNVGWIARVPTAELWRDPYRSGVRRFSQRRDLAALVVVFTFGAYLNAFAMIKPVYALQAGLARWLGTASQAPGLAIIFALGLLVLPALLLTLAGLMTRTLGRLRTQPLQAVILRYVYALVPMGFGMWLAHYAFHFLTGGLTIVPVVQSFLADVGLRRGAPAWGVGPLVPAGWLFPIEAALLYLGALGSIVTAFQIAVVEQSARLPIKRHPDLVAVLVVAMPWMLLALVLLGFGLWILIQPMEMRGTMMLSGTGG